MKSADYPDGLFSFPNKVRKSTDPPEYIGISRNYITSQTIDSMIDQNKWDHRFLELAQFVSGWSKDPSTKVGAVLTDKNNRIISVGYNGFAKGVKDSEARLNNRDVKYKIVCHAEINAILFAARNLTDCTLYTFPFGCCSNCASYVIQTGISRVVFPKTDNSRWTESISISKDIWDESGVFWTELEFSTRQNLVTDL